MLGPAEDLPTACALAAALRDGRLTSAALVEACLARIALRDDTVRAWAHLDPDGARAAARAADARRTAGAVTGPLHGLPVGVKDVFDTADMPTAFGSTLHHGRRPATDAAVVARLREAGAIVLGKTATSEFGMYHPSPTRNPLDLDRSPGVSSSGSAAAVVDAMVPLGIGTQHTASTLLPASFCGAVGFKPSFGTADMAGSNILVPRLAQLGLLARTVDDVALVASVFDPRLALLAPPPVLRVAVVRGPGWHEVSAAAAAAFDRWLDRLPIASTELRLPPVFERSIATVTGLLDAHMARRFGSLPEGEIAMLCAPLRSCIERGQRLAPSTVDELDRAADAIRDAADRLFADHDVLVTLAALGEATRLEEGPGSGVLTMPWSLCGLPTVALPLLRGPSGLPIGVQVIAARGNDPLLLACARLFEGWRV
ncbi:MAG: amidase [Rhodoplanes sp.]|uniref:amidase n=1 Tax=Rhodoplanes sp. TaxID=1968906 RepID=UPI001842DCEB|nr:amidase [Rhodoplanes sp.]NVO17488.1 amidase [Rhodoplanes sp.]